MAKDEKRSGRSGVIARLIEGSIAKQAAQMATAESVPASNQLADTDPFGELVKSRIAVQPPFDLFTLAMMAEMNSELGPCVDAMEKNVDGFGYRIVSNVNLEAENIPPELVEKVKQEAVGLKNFFMYAGMDVSFRKLRMITRRDIELTGNGYWEVIRGASGRIQYFEHMKSYQVRLTAKEVEPVEYEMPIYELQIDGSTEIVSIKRWKRFRRYVQMSSVAGGTTFSSGYKTVWFKEWGDPREYDKSNGTVISPEKLAETPKSQLANEVIHFKYYCARSPYGLPRYIGVLIDIFGDRKASEINFTTFCNNTVPSLIISVSNGELTQDSVDRITEFLEKIQGDDNRSKVLVLEAAPAGEEGEQAGQVKIEVKPLTSEQIQDALFQNYSKMNRDRVRVAFRLPPIIIGRSEDYTRVTADTSRRLADEQVFAPDRDDFDDFINRILFTDMKVLYHTFKSNTPNTTDNTELVQILSGAERTGGMTPRRADLILQDILGRDLPSFGKDPKFDLDLPFSLSMAEAVKNMAQPTEPGQQVTALKDIDEISRITTGQASEIAQAFLLIRNQLEERWQKLLDKKVA